MKQNQKDFFKDLAEAMEKHGVTEIYGWTSHDTNSLCFVFDGEEIETENGYLDDIKKLSE